MKKAIQIHQSDNAATLSADAEISDEVEILTPRGEALLVIKLKEKIPSGHKLALSHLVAGEKIIKYGEVIGVASQPIAQGHWVHTHNVESDRMSVPGKEVK